MNDALETALAYHRRTKHHFERYAAGPDRLDWKHQPDPFRTFAGSPQLELPLLVSGSQPRYVDLYQPGRVVPQPLSLASLAALLELSFGISAWKQHGNARWALRCNPSSGNLHPTEVYVMVEGCQDIADGVHHYLSLDHVLEHRCQFAASTAGECVLPPSILLVGLTSIHWREAWKYGERAYRYCQHDAGHAVAAMRYAAAMLGWKVHLLASWGDGDIGALMGTDRDEDFDSAEREHPDLLLLVTVNPAAEAPHLAPDALVNSARSGRWQGQANRLSNHHSHQWPVIDEAAAACGKPPTRERAWQPPPLPPPLNSTCPHSATEIIRQRRSGQAFDRITTVSAMAFYRMLDMTLPRPDTAPWDAIPWQPRLHLLLFAHRVQGLSPGLYIFLRRPQVEAEVRRQLSAEFEWARVDGCPAYLRLFRLASGDARNAARALSCHQDIAADSAFSLGMLAEYETGLALGSWIYRQLFWEAGIIGQVLYLEAEAAGARGTGIGCYFDDGVHKLVGIKGETLQSLYHFTVGGALSDTRLQTLPAYAEKKGSEPNGTDLSRGTLKSTG